MLDGLEPLQHPPGGFLEGRLQDPAIEALLVTLAQSRRTATAGAFCVVTTRESITDLRGFQTTTAPEWALEHLVPEAGAAVLWNAGARRAGAAAITADDQELKEASREVQGHALTLQLLGSFLSRAHRGDIRKRALVRFDKADAAVQGGHAFRVMGAYEKWLTQSGEEGMRQLAVLRLLGLFDRPAESRLPRRAARAARHPWPHRAAGRPRRRGLEHRRLRARIGWPRENRAVGAEAGKGVWGRNGAKAVAAVSFGTDFPLGEPEDFTPPHGLLAGDGAVGRPSALASTLRQTIAGHGRPRRGARVTGGSTST